MLENVPGIRRLTIPMDGGLDETSPVTELAIEDFMEMDNWRISRDGKRIQKRYGISAECTVMGRDVLGITSYYDSTPTFRELVVLQNGIYRTDGAGSFSLRHTFSAEINHPVDILEIQGKLFVINETDSRMILLDGTDCQIGITAPATLPTLTGGYDAALIEEACAALGTWVDNDAGAGASTQVTYDSKSCFRFLNTGAAGDQASRHIYPITDRMPKKFVLETSIYQNTLGSITSTLATDGFFIFIGTGNGTVGLGFDKKELFVVNGTGWPEDLVSTGIINKLDQWVDIKFAYNASDPDARFCEIYMDDEYQGKWFITDTTQALEGFVGIMLYGASVATDVYVDYINVSDAESANLNGKYRYAVTYARSGNFGCESNPIKSIVGAAAGTGTGTTADLSSGGTYSGEKDRIIRVEVETVAGGIVTAFKVSYDEGNTWHTTSLAPSATMYLSYGVELTWADTEDHIVGDYWDIACDALAYHATNQKITFAAIPTSGDTDQVDQRKIYRTTADGANYYWLATINNNTTTAFVDNIPDTALGLLMEEDKDILPNGKFSAWWDDRLWVTGENVVYYSEIDYPEEFDLLNRKVIVRTGDQLDEITGMKEYGDNLYVFKRNSIYIIQKKAGGGYGRYKIMDGIGCMAGWSIVKVNNVIMWLSDKGVELYNGTDLYSQDFSAKVLRTLDDVEKDKLDCISSGHFREFNEVIWSLPDRGASAAVFLVYNTIKNKFYRFSQAREVSCMSEIEDSGGTLRLAVGNRSNEWGYMNPATTLYEDWETGVYVIEATARHGWINLGKGSQIHGMEIEFEAVTSKDMTLNVYLDMDKDVFYTTTLTGVTPSATDRELRRPIKHFAQLGGREARYLSFEITTTDDPKSITAGDCKINRVDLFFVPKIIKKTQAPD